HQGMATTTTGVVLAHAIRYCLQQRASNAAIDSFYLAMRNSDVPPRPVRVPVDSVAFTARDKEWRSWIRGLGETVCRARKLAGISQVALADRAGISQGAVSRIENGQGVDTPLRSVMG